MIELSNLLYSPHLWQIQDNLSLQAKPIFRLFSADFGLFNFVGLICLLMGLVFYYLKYEWSQKVAAIKSPEKS